MKTKTDIRVRYVETDKMGVVYHANYIVWFEVARGEHLRQKGVNYRKLEEGGIIVPVLKMNCEYKSPAKYDDIVEVETWISKFGRARFTFEYKIRNKESQKLLVIGWSEHVFADDNFKPVNLKKVDLETWKKLLEKEVENGRI